LAAILNFGFELTFKNGANFLHRFEIFAQPFIDKQLLGWYWEYDLFRS
jgi:hypothetical protein